MKSETFNVIAQIWKEIAQNKLPESDIPSHLKQHRFDFFNVGNGFYTIFSPGRLEVDFCSPSVVSCLGYSVEQMNTKFFWECIHPADVKGILTFQKEKLSFYQLLPADKISKYKIRYSFRIKNANGSFTRVLYQALPVEVDDHGAVKRVVAAFTDITHLKTDPVMRLSYIGVSGESDVLDVKTYSPPASIESPFTEREIEVLRLIAKGDSNPVIAGKLNISSVTVSNHRKKMLRKTKAGNTLNLVLLAKDHQWV